MYLDAAKKQEIFEKYGKSNSDTGSAEAQIALFSYRISHLTEHVLSSKLLDCVSNLFVLNKIEKAVPLQKETAFCYSVQN